MERRLTPGSCEMEIINPELNIRFAWFGRRCAAHTLYHERSGARAPANPAPRMTDRRLHQKPRRVAIDCRDCRLSVLLCVLPRESVSMSASLAASSPAPQPRSLRLLSTDDADADDARVAALLDRLAPELAADAAATTLTAAFRTRTSRGCIARADRPVRASMAALVRRSRRRAGSWRPSRAPTGDRAGADDDVPAASRARPRRQPLAGAGPAGGIRQRGHRRGIDQRAARRSLGSPSRGGLPETIARRDGDGWRLSGHKLYSTGFRRCAGWPCGRAPTSRCRESACFSCRATATRTAIASA